MSAAPVLIPEAAHRMRSVLATTGLSGRGLAALLHALPAAVFLCAEDGRILAANLSARRVWSEASWLPSGGDDWLEALPAWVATVDLRLEDGSDVVLLVPDASRIPLEDAPMAPWAVHWQLPPRHARVALLVARGLSDREIAECLDLSWSTARTYAGQVLKLSGVSSRTELAHAMGLLVR